MPVGQKFSPSNPLRRVLALYLHSSGIEAGYGFFAPNVPDSYKLAFELHFADGHVEYDLPTVGSDATGFRLAGVLDYIGDSTYVPLRELMLKMLAYSAYRRHPEVTKIRAVFGSVVLPTPTEFERGQHGVYKFMYAYDFAIPAHSSSPHP